MSISNDTRAAGFVPFTSDAGPVAGGDGDFAQRYAPLPGAYDEMRAADGTLRPQWRMLVRHLDELGPDELDRRWADADRHVREDGFTYNVYASGGEGEPPMRVSNLDLIPLLVADDEWHDVSVGLRQRAALLDLLLADLYGPGRVIREGLLPAELVYANPAFLRPCHGITPAGGRWLHFYGADLARGADGRFGVLNDRTQLPRGVGYALENRIILSRVLPIAFGRCNVEQIAPFFIGMRGMLTTMARPDRATDGGPRVVVLAPGPASDAYFEQSYLASYLGFPLVRGNDLTVRKGSVFLKTLRGLERVDVILRRVDDRACDPLELDPRSSTGVPGLLQAVRAGNVAVANALGTGLIETVALLPFLPGLCQALLGEPLRLASAPTWWCGQPEQLRYVLDHLNGLVIKPAVRNRRVDTVVVDELTSDERTRLRDRIAADPAAFVATQYVPASTTPSLIDGAVRSRRLITRAFACASASPEGGYRVMSGALTRVSRAEPARLASLQNEHSSKDTWIIRSGGERVRDVDLQPVPATALPTTADTATGQTPTVRPLRTGGTLPSRVADDLFWLGRYLQRAQLKVRVARVVFARLVDQVGGGGLIRTATRLAGVLAGERVDLGTDQGARPFAAVIRHPDGAIQSTLAAAHELAGGVRERLSVDAWRIVQHLEDHRLILAAGDPLRHPPDTLESLDALITNFAAFAGFAAESMTHGDAWRFFELGTRIEQATALAELLGHMLDRPDPDADPDADPDPDADADEAPLLDALLDVADSRLTYRLRYLTRIDAPLVVDLLLADASNPRSIASAVSTIYEHLTFLYVTLSHPTVTRVGALQARIVQSDAAALCAGRPRREALVSLLGDVIMQLATTSDDVAATFFVHAIESRLLHPALTTGAVTATEVGPW